MAKHQKRTGRSTTVKGNKGRKSRRGATATAAGKRRTAKKSKKSVSSSSRRKGARKTKKSGKNSDYNLYMKKALSQYVDDELIFSFSSLFFVSRVKADHPTVSHSEAFKMAAQQWSNSPDNPKNK